MIGLDLNKRSFCSGVNCWHLQMVKLSPCETALTFAAQSPPGTEMFPAILVPKPNIIALRLECFWWIFFKPEPQDWINRRLIQYKLIKRLWTSLAASSRKRSVTQEAGSPSFRRASLSTTSRSYSLRASLCNDSVEIDSTKNNEKPYKGIKKTKNQPRMIKITSFSYSLGASVCQDSAQPVRVPLSLLDPADLLGNTWPVSGRTKMVQVLRCVSFKPSSCPSPSPSHLNYQHHHYLWSL